MNSSLPYKLSNEKLDKQKDYGKEVALKYWAGHVESEKYGKATMKGHFLLYHGYGEFPEFSEEKRNKLEELVSKWLKRTNNKELEDLYHNTKLKDDVFTLLLCTIPDIDINDMEPASIAFWLYFGGMQSENNIQEFKAKNKDKNYCHKVIKETIETFILIARNELKNEKLESRIKELDPLFQPIAVCYSFMMKHIDENFKSKVEASAYVDEFINWLQSIKWEEDFPDKYFLLVRLYAAATTITLEAINISTRTYVPYEIRRHPIFLRYYHDANLQTALVNDILSLKKEILEDQKDNPILRHMSRKYSLQECIRRLESQINTLLIGCKELEPKLLETFPNNPALEKFIRNTKTVMDGGMLWQFIAPRYNKYDKLTYEMCKVEYEQNCQVTKLERLGG